MMLSLKSLINQIQSLSTTTNNNDDQNLSVDLLMELIQNGKRDEIQQKLNMDITDTQWNAIKDFKVKLDLPHFENALLNVKPSLSQQEILQYQSIHRKQNK